MYIRAHRVIIWAVCFLLVSLFATAVEAQQGQSEQRRPLSVQPSQDFSQFLFLDELGIQLSISSFYEGFIDIDTYKIGTGDLLGISLEGNVTGSIRGLRVNSQGTIMIPEVGVIRVGDLLFNEAEALISKKVTEKLPDTHAKIVLEHPRTIKVHVIGTPPFSGPQLVLAQTRLDQAVYRSFFQPEVPAEGEGGPVMEDPMSPMVMLANKYPSDFIEGREYSLRNIMINRADGTQESGDLVRYMKTGDQDANPVVQQDDIINITRLHFYNPRVSITGAVNRALDVEYRPDDTIDLLIRMAGGTTYDAADQTIRVHRLTEQGLQAFVLDDSASIAEYEVLPNDRIVIPYNRDKRTSHSVLVYGEAQFTGRFPIEDGKTTLYDLLQTTGGLTDKALPQAAYLLRSQPGRTEFGSFPAFDPTTLTRTSDQFEQGFEYLELEAELILNRVYIDLTDEEQLKEVYLISEDRLFIPKNDGTIFVFGQVNNPGYYNFSAEWSTDAYITNAGGFALSADEERIFIVKSQTNSWYRPDQTTIEPGDLVFVDRVPFDELQAHRNYDLQKRTQRNSNIQLIMTGLTTITSIITAYIAVTR